MQRHEIWFTGSSGYKLYGVLTLPDKTKKQPLVIMLHGFSTSATDKDSYQRLATTLAAMGIASLYYDRMGSGKSTGLFKQTKHTNDLRDLKQIINQLLKEYKFNNKIALYGSSSGGFLAILYAAGDTRIKFLCLKAPNLRSLKFWQRQPGFKHWQKTSTITYLNKTTGKKYPLDHSFYQDHLQLDALTAAKKLTIPVLSIHGDHDTTVPLLESKLLLKALKSKDKQLKIIPGANHWFAGHESALNREIMGWLTQKLARP